MSEQKIIIVVEGGIVQEVVSTGEPVRFRLIDLDEDAIEPVIGYEDTADHIDDEEAFVSDWNGESS